MNGFRCSYEKKNLFFFKGIDLVLFFRQNQIVLRKKISFKTDNPKHFESIFLVHVTEMIIVTSIIRLGEKDIHFARGKVKQTNL